MDTWAKFHNLNPMRSDELSSRQDFCECEKAGAVFSGVSGIIAGPRDGVGRRYIERCDVCERLVSDETAGLEYARLMGGSCQYNGQRKVLWIPR